ncbi:hypothetical protein R77592_03331 [Ralstonia mannitolilytica]|nr:hypothetical protein R77592_03331 [Ralstonia mannitolilytica]
MDVTVEPPLTVIVSVPLRAIVTFDGSALKPNRDPGATELAAGSVCVELPPPPTTISWPALLAGMVLFPARAVTPANEEPNWRTNAVVASFTELSNWGGVTPVDSVCPALTQPFVPFDTNCTSSPGFSVILVVLLPCPNASVSVPLRATVVEPLACMYVTQMLVPFGQFAAGGSVTVWPVAVTFTNAPRAAVVSVVEAVTVWMLENRSPIAARNPPIGAFTRFGYAEMLPAVMVLWPFATVMTAMPT